MAILVTGAAGFIGMHVSAALLQRGEQVIGIDNLNDYYRVALKEARLATLTRARGFRFERLDLAEIEALLRKAGKGYVLGVASNHVFHSWGKQQSIAGTASAIAQSLPKKAWRRLPRITGSVR